MNLKNNLIEDYQKRKDFDYSKCIFEIRLQKKNFFGIKSSVYAYITNSQQLIVCKVFFLILKFLIEINYLQFVYKIIKEPYQEYPNKIIQLKNYWQLQWINKENMVNQEKEQTKIGFRIINDQGLKIEYYADNVTIQNLVQYFEKKLFLINFFEEFIVLKKIGKGKYAKVNKNYSFSSYIPKKKKVYEAKKRYSQQNNSYAVKFICKRLLEPIENQTISIMNEIDILRKLNHENCIKLYSTYEDNEGYYLITDLFDYENTIQKQLNNIKNSRQQSDFIRETIRQLLNGLNYIHSLKIMHRDLKLQNIMLQRIQQYENQFLVKIIDFGLSQYINQKNYIFVHVGTPGYVAPEILQNESESNRYNEKCDIFSLGVLFHILLTGQHVFPGNEFKQILELNKECKIDFNKEIYLKMDLYALDLLKKLLKENPAQRISAKEALMNEYFYNENTPKTIKYNKLFDEKERLKGESNLKQLQLKTDSQKDFLTDEDNLGIDFENLQIEMNKICCIEDLLKNYTLQKKLHLYKTIKQIIQAFTVLEDYQYEDLSFFVSPLKVNETYQTKNIQELNSCSKQSNKDKAENRKEFIKQLKIETQKQEDKDIQILPKNLMKMLKLFPQGLFENKLNGNFNKEHKKIMLVLGKFIILGNQKQQYEINLSLEYFQNKISQIQSNFEQWFIDFLYKVFNSDPMLIPDFLYAKELFDKNFTE